jgi:NAD(P)-dependent dehydrogenase (short-subunit alcohol dehydrogenase family)
MNILIVGGSSGLGYSAAQELAGRGHSVHCLSRRGTAPAGCAASHFDIARDHLESALTADTDVLVISAGEGAFLRPDQVADKIDELIAVNLRGPLAIMADTIVAARRRRKAMKVIAVTSTAGDGPSHGLGVYAACKKGVEGFVRAEGRHAEKKGVTLLAASIGWFDSPMTAALKPEIRRAAESHCTRGRFATLDEATDFLLTLVFEPVLSGVYKFWA